MQATGVNLPQKGGKKAQNEIIPGKYKSRDEWPKREKYSTRQRYRSFKKKVFSDTWGRNWEGKS